MAMEIQVDVFRVVTPCSVAAGHRCAFQDYRVTLKSDFAGKRVYQQSDQHILMPSLQNMHNT